MQIDRRQFGMGLTAIAFAGLARYGYAQLPPASKNEVFGYGALVRDPNSLIDLPKGFSYRVISRFGNLMDDGFVVPNAGDGMGAFAAGAGKVALVRNHELSPRDMRFGPFTGDVAADLKCYDRMADKAGMPLPGGTSTLIYDLKSGRVESQYLSLTGTIRNCAGGITPWGSWLTCEENTTRAGDGVGKDHGYVFEVPSAHKGLVDPVPLTAMGRFNHEAACVDPRTGIVYETEDRDDSLLYRFIPNVKGDLAKGGQLQALVIDGVADSRNWDGAAIQRGQPQRVRWISLDNPEAPEDDLRKRGAKAGATVFARGEGIWWDKGALPGSGQFYFTCTSGGAVKGGQVFRYAPAVNEGFPGETDGPGMIDLFYESKDLAYFNLGDNLTVMPTGHLMVCEDQYTDVTDNHLRGITPDGKAYAFAKSRVQTEFAGACFSPDGSTLFVNFYAPTMTLAITGPWAKVRA
ncbi:MAG: alkaline phosphatase PhoX [Sphingorhabdus sp.]